MQSAPFSDRPFFERIENRARALDSLLVVGLDPRVARAAELLPACMRVVEATAHLACAFKPNVAFFEAHGAEGILALEELFRRIPPGIPTILDAKRGDIGDTNAAYARAVLRMGAGSLTVSPYLGVGALSPFLRDRSLGIFVLARTSNPEAWSLQELGLASGRSLFEQVAIEAEALGLPSRVGLVAGATNPRALARVRKAAPRSWILVPGVGSQGGDLAGAVAAGLREDGLGVLVNASRSIASSADPGQAAMELVAEIRAARAFPAAPGPRFDVGELGRVLHDAEVVRFGEFTLRSGKHSPIYVDLRRLVSYPRALRRVTGVYAELLSGLAFDRIAALPYAALPIGTAVALYMDRPLVYPRGQPKSHGGRSAIEGVFSRGERAVVLDDLATRGDTKLEALTVLREGGLDVKDVVVLVDREQGAREILTREGIALHAAFTLRELVVSLRESGRIDGGALERVLRFLDAETP